MVTPSYKAPRYSLSLSVLLTLTLLFPTGTKPVPAAAKEVSPHSAAGDLDPSFGVGGKVVTDFAAGDDAGSSVAIQPDGKILVGGKSTALGDKPDFALARYNADGGLDPSFGLNGRVITDFFDDADSLGGIALQPGGKIVAAGSAVEPGVGSVFAVARYNPDGSLDPSFGLGGKTTTRFPEEAEAAALALTPTGKILAVGTASPLIHPRIALARYNPDGNLDASFGTNGIVVNTVASNANRARAVVLQTDNKIVIAGDDSLAQSSALFRYNPDGSPDSGFGNAGAVLSGFLLVSLANALVLQPDGKIVVAGFGQTSVIKNIFVIARHNPNGTIDANFGDLGSTRTVISMRHDGARALAIQSNGKILAAGFAGAPGDFFEGFSDFVVVRYKPQGKLDNPFGSLGKVVTDFFGGSDVATAIALQTDGKIVLAGTAQSTTNDFAIARYVVEDFAVKFDPPTLTAARGTTVFIDLLIDHLGGFEGDVTVTLPDLSAIGVKLKPSNKIVTSHTQRTLRLKVKPTAQLGVHQITLKAEDEEGRERTAVLTLTIQ